MHENHPKAFVISVARRLPSCDDNDVDGDDEADDLQSKPNDLDTEEYLTSPVEPFLPEADARIIRRAKKIMMYVFSHSALYIC